jgi:hypothetical protein
MYCTKQKFCVVEVQSFCLRTRNPDKMPKIEKKAINVCKLQSHIYIYGFPKYMYCKLISNSFLLNQIWLHMHNSMTKHSPALHPYTAMKIRFTFSQK